MQAQTLQEVRPVCAGEFCSAAAGELEVAAPGGSTEPEDVPEVVLDDPVLPELVVVPSPGDCAGGIYGDCTARVSVAKQAPEAAERAAA